MHVVLRKFRTLFTTNPRWFFHYYMKYGRQNLDMWRNRNEKYKIANILGIELTFYFDTPYHLSYALSAQQNAIETHLIEPWIEASKRAKIIYDVGGYNGIYGLLAAKVNPGAQVTIFEPDHVNARHIRENIKVNALTNCKLIEKPVSEHKMVTKFEQTGVTSSHIGEGEEIETVSLEDLPPADLIKLDIEGFEVGVLRSLRGTNPIILFELHPAFLNRAGDSMETFKDELKYWRYWFLGQRDDQQHYLLF